VKPCKFDYKTLDALAQDCRTRSLPIEFNEDTGILYEPIEVNGRRVGNRLIIHPMEGSDATLNGKPGELTFRRWRRFATGGAKMIWGEAAAVIPEGRSNPRQLLMIKPNVREFSELLRQTRQAHRETFGGDSDFLVGIQLAHAGRHCFQKPAIAFHSPVHDRFTCLDKRTGQKIPGDYPVVNDVFLAALEDDFVEAARSARNAGFDFVDIKQCHSYLLNELLAAHMRSGKYGGSFENRTRCVRNVTRKIKEALGDDILLASRLNVYDGIPHMKDAKTDAGTAVNDGLFWWRWGTDPTNSQKEDLSEPERLVEILFGHGLSLLSISAGSPYWSPHLVRPFSKPVDGGYASPEHPLEGVSRLFRLTEEMQKAFPHIPVAGSGYSWLRQFSLNAAAANVRAEKVSLVGFGRTAIAYPDFASDGRTREGMNPKKACLADSMCSNMLRAWSKEKKEKIATGCPVRDSRYKEIYASFLK
jgi:NADPH2 dehydrogenase